RRGSRSLAVIGAIASQPTNDSIRAALAPPTAVQPCGANGVQFAHRADGAAPTTAATTRTTRTATSTSCAVLLVLAPPRVRATTAASSTAAATTVVVRPPPSRLAA